MQTFDQSLMDLVARGDLTAAEATAVSINPHNFRLELTQLTNPVDPDSDDDEGNDYTSPLGTGLRPRH
jgi:Tfp pilus assembly ATPase PilU